MSSWWLMIFVFLFLLPPVGYGWGYRGWGPPLPRWVQRRRGRAAIANGPSTFDHHAWGWGGDAVWMAVMIWIGCAIAGTLIATR